MVAMWTRMEERYAGWQEDLPPDSDWPAFFAEYPAPDFEAIPDAIEIAAGAQVWSGRRDDPLPGAPAGAHICRAFEGIQPEEVRVMVPGEDPYAALERATGCAFEDGIADAAGGALRPAPRNLGKSARAPAGGGQKGPACPPRPGRAAAIRAHFDSIRDQVALFVNTSWTFTMTDDDHKAAHMTLWQPVT